MSASSCGGLRTVRSGGDPYRLQTGRSRLPQPGGRNWDEPVQVDAKPLIGEASEEWVVQGPSAPSAVLETEECSRKGRRSELYLGSSHPGNR